MRVGAAQTERQSPAAAAAVDHMTVEEAHEALAAAHPLRPIVRDALYGYWRAKRERTGKPLIRRLQAPTSASDQNPYGVFRRAPVLALGACGGAVGWMEGKVWRVTREGSRFAHGGTGFSYAKGLIWNPLLIAHGLGSARSWWPSLTPQCWLMAHHSQARDTDVINHE